MYEALALSAHLDQRKDHDDLSAELRAILDRELTPENIETYADDALDGVINIVERAVADYDDSDPILSRKDRESAALAAQGMSDVETVLDQLADMLETVHGIDPLIDNAPESDGVIVPTDAGPGTLYNGESVGHLNRQPVQRTKTVLFVLSQDYGIDISDPEATVITKGRVNPAMVRQKPYNAIRVPQLNRVFLVCDESSQTTFVFDTTRMAVNEVPDESLLTKTKDDLKELINNDASVGTTILYNPKSYIPRIKDAIDSPLTGRRAANGPRAGAEHYLIPEAPEGYETLFGVSKILGVTRDRVQEAITGLGDALGEVGEYRMRRVTKGYSPEQIAMIGTYIEQNTTALTFKDTEGYASVNEIKNLLGVGNVNYIKDATSALGIERLELRKSSAYYPLDKVDDIRRYLEENSSAFVETLPADYANETMIARATGASIGLVKICVGELMADERRASELGKVGQYKLDGRGRASLGFSPQQRAIVTDYVMARGSRSNRSSFKGTGAL